MYCQRAVYRSLFVLQVSRKARYTLLLPIPPGIISLTTMAPTSATATVLCANTTSFFASVHRTLDYAGTLAVRMGTIVLYS